MKKNIITIYKASPAGKQEANLMRVFLLEEGSLNFKNGDVFKVLKVMDSKRGIHYIGKDSLYRITSEGKFFHVYCQYKTVHEYADFETALVKRPRVLRKHSWQEAKEMAKAKEKCHSFA